MFFDVIILAGQPTNEDGDVNYTFDCNTTLYTKLAVPCEVLKLVCSAKFDLQWLKRISVSDIFCYVCRRGTVLGVY